MHMFRTVPKLFFVVVLSTALSAVALAETFVTPKGKSCKVYAAASKKSNVIGELKVNETAASQSRKGMYWHVKLPNGEEGFVSVLKVKRQKGSSSSLAEAIKNAAKESRNVDDEAGARARSAVMGVRGLDDGGNVASAGNVTPNLRMVYAMEDVDVDPEAVEALGNEIFAEISSRVKN